MFCRHWILVVLFGLFFFGRLSATHNRAGEITYKRIAPFTTVVAGITVPAYTYSITVIIYTDDGPFIADRCLDTLNFGDGQWEVIGRQNGSIGSCDCPPHANKPVACGVVIVNEIAYKVKQNIYSTIHTYPGAGVYKISTADRNRNKGVHNIPQSVNQPFYVESMLIIKNFTGANTSPQFSFPPIDKACLNSCFEHNPGAFDIDGDSLSYEISESRTTGGVTVPGYSYPETGPGGSYGIDAVTGILRWCKPQVIDEYNLAFIVREWRKNTSGEYILVGYVLRDMQVIVNECVTNLPPLVAPVPALCVEAGKLISEQLVVSDPNAGQTVTITGGGGGFDGSSPFATLSPTSGVIFTNARNSYTSTFKWQTNCNHARLLPYFCTVKATDSGFLTENKLVSFMTFQIRVVPPAISGLSAVPLNNSLKLSWNATNCNPSANPLITYHIYRSNSCETIVFDPCQASLPSTSGYTLIGNVGASVTSFLDTNNGEGLAVGQNYSYVIVAEYKDGLQSFAGLPFCTELKKNIPILTQVDVTSTDLNTGSIALEWLPPLTTAGNLDLNVFKGPYRYVLRHRKSTDVKYSELANFAKTQLLDLPLNFIHNGVNTDSVSHEYILDFYSDTTLIGTTLKNSSIFLKATPDDRKVKLNWRYTNTWTNYKFHIYRRDPNASTFTFIDTVRTNTYTDMRAIVNGSNYCYYVKAEGRYSDPTIVRPLFNRSQIACATAIDKVVPVAPITSISANCATNFVEVHWSDIKPISDDVASYQLLYKPNLDANYVPIATFKEGEALGFNNDNVGTFGGCYAVKATDINGNIGPQSDDLCVDICPEFELPNVFTPNSDQVNDFFKAIRVKQIKEIDLNVVDRWGNLVFHTTDPYFLWNGISQVTHLPCSEGTFMYVCHVYEPRIRGTVKRSLHGVVQLIR